MSIINYLTNHAKALVYSLHQIDPAQLEQLCELLDGNQHKLLLTGIGKNGHVAATAASTFCSIGVQATFINPVDAMHGDLGLIQPNDIIIAISKSGETAELLAFLQQAHAKLATIVLIHSNLGNSGLRFAHKEIYVPCDVECDHLHIVPTASIITFTACLQSIACELADQHGMTTRQFVKNHPGGTLGKLSDN